jgi:hypothetical protein
MRLILRKVMLNITVWSRQGDLPLLAFAGVLRVLWMFALFTGRVRVIGISAGLVGKVFARLFVSGCPDS